MRRFIVLFIVLGLIVPMRFVPSAFADSAIDDPPDDKIYDDHTETYLFQQKLEEKYADWINQTPNYAQLEVYYEPYYHYTDNGEIDWALIRYRIGESQGPLSVSVSFGNVVIGIANIENNYLGMSVYDVKKDDFIPITIGDLYHITAFDYSDYDGFEEALVWLAKNWNDSDDNVKIIMRGDADYDKTISILDATRIQRNLVGIVDTGMIVDNKVFDYNNDGDVTILDATAIQRHLVDLSTET